jgi:uncharacterized lipoprotein YbaY
MTRLACLGLAAALAVSLAACGDKDKGAPEPQNETTAATMPDTDAVANTGAVTAPDAGATGAVNAVPAGDGMGANTTP